MYAHPGGSPKDARRYFDPTVWRAVLFDQRGAGRSTPAAELRENTTWHLVEDIERLRKHLEIDKWVLYGGSWGSTLSLSYAQTHPERVKAMVLRGIFNLRRSELQFFYQQGTDWLFPDHFEDYQSNIPVVERHDMMSAYYRRLTGEDEEEKLRCAKAWCRWEMATMRILVNKDRLAIADDPEFALKYARIECHYFVHGGFFNSDEQLLDGAKILREHNIPGSIFQGRYDCVCPARTAWELHKRWPEANFVMVPDSGHFGHVIRDSMMEELRKYQHL